MIQVFFNFSAFNLKYTDEFSEDFKKFDPIHTTTTDKKSAQSNVRQAIKYFSRLEAKTIGNSIPEKYKKDKAVKKLSLEINRYKRNKMGGSLNLPNLSSRFALSNVYDDIFGKGRTYFKGVPNRSALVEALATFPRKDNTVYSQDSAEDDIKFDLFKKRIKAKKRKSIRSVFDVCY